MSTDLTSLYQDVIIEHARRPRNFGRVPAATCVLDGHNPLCGDQLTLYLTLVDGRITEIGFEGAGCAISQASASLMTVAMKGLTREQAMALWRSTIFATGPGGLLVFSADGTHLGTIDTGERTANCAWGDDGSMLYIMADMYICRIQTSTKGRGW